MKNIIHDWNDDKAAVILDNIRKVLPKEGRVILLESVIPEGNEAGLGKIMDLEMLVMPGGRERTELDAVAWAQECVARGAGEILLTSIDRDGARTGYDVALTRAVSSAVHVPVIASGGAGSAAHVCDALTAGADAALLAGILHDGVTTVRAIKHDVEAAGLPVRAA